MRLKRLKKNNQLKKQMENKTLLIWKMAVASCISWEVAKFAGSHHPYLAPISVILCLQSTINRSILFSYHRMVGTIIGISVTVIAAPHLKVNGWTLGILMLVGGFIAKWLKRDETALHQVALTILLVFVFEHKAGSYPMDRFRDTLIGAIVAVVIHMIAYPPNFTKQAEKNIQKFVEHLSTTYAKVSTWIKSGLPIGEGHQLQAEVKTLLEELHQMRNLLKDASDSVKYNPFGHNSKKQLKKYEKSVLDLSLGYTYLSSVVGNLNAWAKTGTITPMQIAIWADQIHSLGLFFETKGNPAVFIQPGDLLKVFISPELEKKQYPISLYHDTVQLINEIKQAKS
jgi:uncharacterized membrane protein YgaE (UPF0421/DUF939 family)